DFQSAAPRQVRQFCAQCSDVIARTTNGIANFGAQLNDRLVPLRLDLLFKRDFSAFENFVNMRTQFTRLRVDDCELLFDSQSEDVLFRAHGGVGMFLKNVRMSSKPPPTPRGTALHPTL